MSDKVVNILKSNNKNNYEITVNSKEDKQLLYRMVESMFSNQNISVRKENKQKNEIVVRKNGEVISSSSSKKLKNSILLTNSDQYKTQKGQMDKLVFPESILSLQNETFNLKGYPKAYNEKLILISISRYIEKLSYKYGGTHHSTFQKLSRINDEKGTREIYDELSTRVNELHIYGQPDIEKQLNIDGIIHRGSSKLYKNAWIVIHLSENHSAALIAMENKNAFNEWTATWTFDREKVIKLEDNIRELF